MKRKSIFIAFFIFICLLGCATIRDYRTSRAIPKLHTGILTIKTTPNVKVTVKQIEHEFCFGTAISTKVFVGKISSMDRQKYLELLKANFNCAVHENALKWYSTEPQRDLIMYYASDTILKWSEDNELKMRGHCVYWSKDRYVQPWLKLLDDTQLHARLKQRAFDLLIRYKGRIAEYDVNNEMLHGDYYKKRFGNSIRHRMFQWCKDADPSAILYVNDYGILNGKALNSYEKQIESFLKAGVPIGGIGLQGHFDGSGVNAAKIRYALDRLARFNLPIKITEFDINTNDEDLKAKGLAELYKTAFGHPAVEGILMWGFWEGAHWIPHAALWKKDWTPTKAAKVYRDLVYNQWWTQYDGMTDEQGICQVRVFYGLHEVSIDGSEPMIVWIGKNEGSKTITKIVQQNSPEDK
jgi:endo-1,4-beta-xylanase